MLATRRTRGQPGCLSQPGFVLFFCASVPSGWVFKFHSRFMREKEEATRLKMVADGTRVSRSRVSFKVCVTLPIRGRLNRITGEGTRASSRISEELILAPTVPVLTLQSSLNFQCLVFSNSRFNPQVFSGSVFGELGSSPYYYVVVCCGGDRPCLYELVLLNKLGTLLLLLSLRRRLLFLW